MHCVSELLANEWCEESEFICRESFELLWFSDCVHFSFERVFLPKVKCLARIFPGNFYFYDFQQKNEKEYFMFVSFFSVKTIFVYTTYAVSSIIAQWILWIVVEERNADKSWMSTAKWTLKTKVRWEIQNLEFFLLYFFSLVRFILIFFVAFFCFIGKTFMERPNSI